MEVERQESNWRSADRKSQARFPFKRNRLRCVRCVNENRKKRKRQPIGMLGRSSGNHDWLLANASACVSCGFVYATHATQAIAFEWKPTLTLYHFTITTHTAKHVNYLCICLQTLSQCNSLARSSARFLLFDVRMFAHDTFIALECSGSRCTDGHHQQNVHHQASHLHQQHTVLMSWNIPNDADCRS